MGITSKWWMATVLIWFVTSLWCYSTSGQFFTQADVSGVNGMLHPVAANLNIAQVAWDFLTQSLTFWNYPFFHTTMGFFVLAIEAAFLLPVIIPVGYQIAVLIFKPFGGS